MNYNNNLFTNRFGAVALAIMISWALLVPSSLPAIYADDTSTLKVRAYSTDGNTLSMYTTIKSDDGTTVESGFTPLTYTGTRGETYIVTISNYKDRNFEEWANENTSRSRTLTLWADTTAVAYYDIVESTTITASDSDSSSSAGIKDLIPKTGVMVALYMYPGSTGSEHWQKVIDKKKEHPSVPIVAIFNPSSGPGTSKNSNFAEWVEKLQDAGVIAMGYVADNYGGKSLSTLKEQADKYYDWYKADGLYIDEFTNKPGLEDRYSELTDYAKSLGMKITGGNAGTDVPPSYIGTVDVIKIAEGPGYIATDHPNIIGSTWVSGGYSGWHSDYDKTNFAIVRYDVSWLDKSFVTEISESIGLLYLTDGNDSNSRWFHIPSYFGDLVATLD